MNSGKPNLVDSKKEKIETLLNQYAEKIKISNLEPNARIDEYLSYTREHLEALSKAECLQLCYDLDRHCLIIDKEYNTNVAYRNWADRELNTIAAKYAHEYSDTKYIKWDYVKAKIVTEHSYAFAVDQLFREAKIRTDYLYNMSKRIESISNTVRQLAYSKENR